MGPHFTTYGIYYFFCPFCLLNICMVSLTRCLQANTTSWHVYCDTCDLLRQCPSSCRYSLLAVCITVNIIIHITPTVVQCSTISNTKYYEYSSTNMHVLKNDAWIVII